MKIPQIFQYFNLTSGQKIDGDSVNPIIQNEEYVMKLLVEKVDLAFPKTATLFELLKKISEILKFEGNYSLIIPHLLEITWPLSVGMFPLNFLFFDSSSSAQNQLIFTKTFLFLRSLKKE